MDNIDDYDVSQLRWWRCIAIDQSDKIRVLTVEVDPNNIYRDFSKIRKDLIAKGLKFVEAKPITKEERLAADKLAKLKERRLERLRGLTGRRYSSLSHWLIALSVALPILLILWLA
ncbi:MAG: hypothetical protein M0R50_11505, partial [Candidatus Cloacimonetes bacterium]|nr:hypothetical protein [Candidatus Cloacimonadota bacterium]